MVSSCDRWVTGIYRELPDVVDEQHFFLLRPAAGRGYLLLEEQYRVLE